MSFKSIKKQSLDELLNALGSDIDEQSESDTVDSGVLKFISTYNLASGDYPVKLTLLYKLYLNFEEEPETFKVFNQLVRFNLTDEQNSSPVVHLNKSALNISESLYELLKAKNNKTKSLTFKSHFENFIADHKIEAGDNYISLDILFYLYDKWSYERPNIKTMSKSNLSEFFKLNFKSKRFKLGQSKHFAINNAIDEQQLKHINEWITRGEENKKRYKVKK